MGILQICYASDDWQLRVLCDDQPMMTYLPHPDDCNKFFVCIEEQPFIMDCPFGLYYDRMRELCAYPGEVLCPADPLSPKKTTKKPMTTTKRTKMMKKSTTKKSTQRPNTTTTPTTESYEFEEDFSDVIATGVLPKFPKRDSASSENEEVNNDVETQLKGHQVECCSFYSSVCWDC